MGWREVPILKKKPSPLPDWQGVRIRKRTAAAALNDAEYEYVCRRACTGSAAHAF
jgi:hypothetical protein